MPLREYRCRCGHAQDELICGDYPDEVVCEQCGGKAKYRFAPAAFKFGFRDGYDWGAGAHFNSDRERNNYIAEKGLRRLRD